MLFGNQAILVPFVHLTDFVALLMTDAAGFAAKRCFFGVDETVYKYDANKVVRERSNVAPTTDVPAVGRLD